MQYRYASLCCVLLLGLTSVNDGGAADWPCLGRDFSRNPVSPEQNPPTDWDIETGRNIKWKAEIASHAAGAPVVSEGLVWIGGNRWRPGESEPKDAALLLCFDEQSGEKMYEYVSPRVRGVPLSTDPSWHGLGSSPLVEGNRLWFVTNRGEAVCLDVEPLKRQPREQPQVVWKVDMREKFGVSQTQPFMGPNRLCSIAPSYQGLIYVSTCNGVDESRHNIPAPDAPGLICFDKDTGEAKWQVRTGENVLYSELASPLVAEIAGRGQVVMPHGDGWVRSYDPHSGQLLWECDTNPKASRYKPRGVSPRNYLLATPVLYEDRIYIANGHQPNDGEGPGRLLCIDPTKSGDISSELAVDANGNAIPPRRLQNVDAAAGERAISNPNSGVVWMFADQYATKRRWDKEMHCTLANVAIHNRLLVVPDFEGFLHCLDARTGQPHWHYELLTTCWASSLIVGNTVYVAAEDGAVHVLKLEGRPLDGGPVRDDEPPEPIARIEMGSQLLVPPIYANGVLYITTRSTLYAIQSSPPE